jgi:hypothetical protein
MEQDERVAKGITSHRESANRDLSRLEDHLSARLFKAWKTLRQQTTFNANLPRRADDPS